MEIQLFIKNGKVEEVTLKIAALSKTELDIIEELKKLTKE